MGHEVSKEKTPEDAGHHRAKDGRKGLSKALAKMKPQGILERIELWKESQERTRARKRSDRAIARVKGTAKENRSVLFSSIRKSHRRKIKESPLESPAQNAESPSRVVENKVRFDTGKDGTTDRSALETSVNAVNKSQLAQIDKSISAKTCRRARKSSSSSPKSEPPVRGAHDHNSTRTAKEQHRGWSPSWRLKRKDTSFKSKKLSKEIDESERSTSSKRQRKRDRIMAFFVSTPMRQDSVNKVVEKIKRREELRKDQTKSENRNGQQLRSSSNRTCSSDDSFPTANPKPSSWSPGIQFPSLESQKERTVSTRVIDRRRVVDDIAKVLVDPRSAHGASERLSQRIERKQRSNEVKKSDKKSDSVGMCPGRLRKADAGKIDRGKGRDECNPALKPSPKSENKCAEKCSKLERSTARRKEIATSNEDNDGHLLDSNGIPFWNSMSDYVNQDEKEDENTDEELPMNADLLLTVQSGQRKLVSMPPMSLMMDPYGSLDRLKARDAIFFNKEVLFSNTVRTMVNINDQVDLSEQSRKLRTGRKVHWVEPSTITNYVCGAGNEPIQWGTEKYPCEQTSQ